MFQNIVTIKSINIKTDKWVKKVDAALVDFVAQWSFETVCLTRVCVSRKEEFGGSLNFDRWALLVPNEANFAKKCGSRHCGNLVAPSVPHQDCSHSQYIRKVWRQVKLSQAKNQLVFLRLSSSHVRLTTLTIYRISRFLLAYINDANTPTQLCLVQCRDRAKKLNGCTNDWLLHILTEKNWWLQMKRY